MSDRPHILVLGGGLAGSFMACRLIQAGAAVTMIDDRHPASASRVAAGLYNVITGRFGAKTWMAESLLTELDQVLNDPFFEGIQRFVHPLEIYRPFKDVEEYNRWSGRSAEPGYKHLVAFEEQPQLPDLIHNPLGGIRILPCGWVNISGLIDHLLEIMVRQGGRLLTGTIPYDRISLEQNQITWENELIPFDQIVACEGARIRQNPWFADLPVQPNKGEILDIHAPGLAGLPFVITRKVYLVPGEGDTWVVGSTYQNHFEDPHPSESGKAEILEHLDKVLKVPYTVTGHRAGIRPTSPNRRPIMGTHPDWPQLHALTGFGTKGMLAAPWSSRLMASYILAKQVDIPEEVNISRFRAFRPRR